MFGRATIIQADPSKLEERIAFVRDRVQPSLDGLAGSRGVGMWANAETGEAIITTAWEDREALERSEESAAGLRSESAAILGPSNVRVEVEEPVVIWQAASDQPGYWTRFVEMDLPADRIDDGIALFRDEILPVVQQIPGVNTVVLLVNRDSGRSVLNVTYRSKAELEAAREKANTLRASVVSRLGAGEPVIHELQTIIVGIRGPEIIQQAQRSESTQQAPA